MNKGNTAKKIKRETEPKIPDEIFNRIVNLAKKVKQTENTVVHLENKVREMGLWQELLSKKSK